MIIEDPEFGEVIVKKSPLAKGVKFSIATSGRLQMSVPSYAKKFLIKRYLNSARNEIKRTLPIKDPATQRARDAKARLLTKSAKSYLPYRLEYLAKTHGYHYDKLKFGHQATRWGSCTRHHDGTTVISLNVGLMQVPEQLRDYVLIHELAHLNHPDHSSAFWAEVAKHDPRYKDHRKKLKAFSPGV